MAPRHWLDPLARRLLQATGQLPPDRRPGLAQQPNRRPNGLGGPSAGDGTPRNAPAAGALNQNLEHQDIQSQIERELLALKLRQNPSLALRSAEDVRLLASLGWRLDVNRATRSDWLRLPGISADQVDLLLRLQAGGVQLSGPEDLQRLLDLPSEQLQAWVPALEFRWYGEPPAAAATRPALDLNRATRQELRGLGLSAERCQRLLRERARQPFQDLADLQQRLQLPPALVESWIGKVRFGSGPIGPVLPPPRRRPA